MKLRLPLALLLGLSLACGSEDEETPTPPPPPPEQPVTETPPPPPPQPPPPVENGGSTDGADGEATNGADGTATAATTEGTDATKEGTDGEEEEPTTRVESLNIEISLETRHRRDMRSTAEREFVRKAKSMGYSKVNKIHLADIDCNDTRCIAKATGVASRTVKIEEDEEEGEE